jgi:adenosylmethionine-8-amino-7-oxononanoate aminotransferase
MERLDLLANVRANEGYFAEQLHGLAGDHEIIGDVRGAGYFMSLELVKDRATRETFSAEECQVLLREFLSPQLQEAGVICRADDRGDPVIQFSPPLIADTEQFEEIHEVLHGVLTEAWDRVKR